jgi:hypothetical protein
MGRLRAALWLTGSEYFLTTPTFSDISLIHVFIEIQARRFGEAQAAASKH